MASNPINVNAQMQKLADNAVAAAKEKFGVSLDFSENSLQQLDSLLQQAHEGYKKASGGGNPANISIENTVRVWGSYFGEVIRRSLGGDWIVDQKNVFLQTGSRRLDPFGQVRLQMADDPQNDIQSFFLGVKSGIQNDEKDQLKMTIPDMKNSQSSNIEKGTKSPSAFYVAVIFVILIFIVLCGIGVLMLQKQGVLSIPGFSLQPTPTSTQIKPQEYEYKTLTLFCEILINGWVCIDEVAHPDYMNIPGGQFPTYDQIINDMGSNGWRLVSSQIIVRTYQYAVGADQIVTFERQK